ncbi:MAG: carbohydrate kinase family protein [Lachnospiraceae bacterium]|nr:carbohydrate kinase family protein [Lachnospiraceae bacterium]
MKRKVIAAGHICLDITPIFTSEKVDNLTDILAPGKLIQMGSVDVHTGGSVANTGLAMKLLGANVSLMGKIGRDSFGEMVLNILRKYDAQDGMIVSDEENTSYSVVLAIPGIDRIFLHNPGANNTFCSSDIPEDALAEAAMFHFGYPPLMASMYEAEGTQLTAMMKRVKEAGVATSLDLAAVDADSESGRADWDGILRNVMPYIDFFVPSVEELCYMIDKKRFREWNERAAGRDVTEILDIDRDVRPLADKCMSYGAKILLIKCGAPGLYYRSASREVLQDIGRKAELDTDRLADREGFETSYVPDAVLSATGAGDTSIAAFLTAILEGYTLEESVRLAAATGASCVASYDALSGLRSFNELEQKIAAGWRKRDVSKHE